ncbi:MAG: putative membrane protein [Planctomycetota bacterium]
MLGWVRVAGEPVAGSPLGPPLEYLLFLILALIGSALVWVTLARRVAELNRQVRALQKQVDSLARAGFKGSSPAGSTKGSPAASLSGAPPPRPAKTTEVIATLAENRQDTGELPEPSSKERDASGRAEAPPLPAGHSTPGTATREPQPPVLRDPKRTQTAPPAKIDWERWVGIRGAAVVGSIALVLAGLFFVQVAIDRGWLGPAARDLMALGIGGLALLFHGPLRKRKLMTLADSVAGAGTVLMYGGAWAAARLHDLVPPSIALLVMAATTGTALLMSLRSNAPILASFALVGGFATPVLLGTLQRESTATLFGYVLVLDLTIVVLSRLRGWVLLVPGALVGTTVLQFAWSETNADHPLPLAVVALFGAMSALLFTVAIVRKDGRAKSGEDPDPWIVLAALAAPFVLMGRQLVQSIPVDTPLWIVAAFAGVLACASAAAAAHFRTGFYLVGTAMSSVALLGALRLRTSLQDTAGEWTWSGSVSFDQWALYSLALMLVFMALAAWVERRTGEGKKPAVVASGAPYAFALLSVFPGVLLAGMGEVTVEGALLGVTFAFALLGAHGARFAKGGHWPGALLGLVTGWTAVAHNFDAFGVQDFGTPLFWSIPAFSLACALFAHAFRIAGRVRLGSTLSSMAPFIALSAFANAAIRASQGPASAVLLGAAAALAIAFACAWPVREHKNAAGSGPRHLSMALGSLGIAALLIALNAHASGSWRSAHLQPFYPGGTLTALAVLLGALPAAASIRARRALLDSDLGHPWESKGIRFSSWFTAFPLLLLLVAPSPLGGMLWACSLGSETVTDALRSGGLRHTVLLGGSLVALLPGLWMDRVDRRLAAGALSVTSILVAATVAREFSAHAATAAASLSAGAMALLAARAGLTAWTQVMGAFALLPVVALLGFTFMGGAFLATGALLPLQLTLDFGLVLTGTAAAYAALGRLQHHSDKSDSTGDAVVSLRYAHAASVLALLFGWMNAAVLNQFADPGEPIRLMNERLQARDLSLSLSWGVFAGVLLAWGMMKRSAALRWTSLCLFVAFILKVFLYDLGALTGLPRVGSFLGLAVALLGVSLLYARVLGTEPKAASEPEAQGPDPGGETDPDPL